MKAFIIGLLAICGVLLGAFILCVLTLMGLYGFGWAVGWGFELIVPMSKFFGIEFPQLVGLMTVFSTMFASAVSAIIVPANKAMSKKLEEKIEETVAGKFKQYRGY